MRKYENDSMSHMSLGFLDVTDAIRFMSLTQHQDQPTLVSLILMGQCS